MASQEKKKSRKEIRRHLKVVVVNCLKYYLHLKEKVVEKGETNREKLEWIRLQDALLYFHLIGTIARCSFIFSHYCRDCKMLDPFHIFSSQAS